ncbi:alpha-glucuronidase family glycosyl hydrolase [Aquiflexum gelatinilyticum]|uniref:alpha-glucuronidase family glycosyl hydrolase n=1 Tax=Aquiflexum gelatinilyticum TaxID=2961943 RepID=UPI002168179E|nr:alpha-glucuronidase family glycosyl hydrolase [Aquiflexum gelatinilyticum]MCS4433194.1 alpha-glucuronidase [Aquiflexum gelatinilyticum]
MSIKKSGATIVFFILISVGYANDGYKLWLQYLPFENKAVSDYYRDYLENISISGESPTLDIIQKELIIASEGFFDQQVLPEFSKTTDSNLTWIIRSEDLPEEIKGKLGTKLSEVKEEGYWLKSYQGKIIITAKTDIGLLYGTFAFLKAIQTREKLENLDRLENPKIQKRLLNHWDNLNRTVERGYAGFSIWNWHRLPNHIDQQYIDYARANASIGINGTSIFNVNSNALILTPEYLAKAKALADAFRPYGIKIYLTARFNAPMILDSLPTADPLDPDVQIWWKKKTEEIYSYIPDFGGFLVKADSEGQPGPHNYGRTQADGANMLADAVKPFGGIVMWRAFVYNEKTPTDRIRQAYDEFKPLDGKFRDNVIVQVKNGPLDFQPREPFHPLFGAMPKTPLMMEFQITKEYLGQETHWVNLATMWREILQSDTYAKGKGSTVSKVIDGSLHGYKLTGIAGVANIGTDRNWTGHQTAQADWYAFGKLAWNPDSNIDEIAENWLKMTFSNDVDFVATSKEIMLQSHEILVNYMTPLGLHHIMARSHHWGPGPWVTGGGREDWTATYYHKASEEEIGFDRTEKGSNALAQYAPEWKKTWGDADKIPLEYLLWFHRVSWDKKLSTGNNLWTEMALRYQKGVEGARWMQSQWAKMEGKIDQERYEHISSFFKIQVSEAEWWRDSCLLYFQQFSKMPLPPGVEKPKHVLKYYLNFKRNFVPGI